MRILMINYELPPLGGGAGNATAHLAREMATLGHEVTVLTSAFGDLARDERVDDYRVVRIPCGRRRLDRCSVVEMVLFLLSGLWHAPRLARTERPDAVVAFFGVPSGPVALWLRLRLGLPYVVSLRGGDVPGFQDAGLAFYHRLCRPLIRRIWGRAAAVVANSAGLRDLALQTAPDLPVEIIPNGVDTDVFHPPEDRSPGEHVRLLFVGRLVHQKGVDVLLDALARVPEPARFRLEIVGDGPLRARLEAQARDLGLADVVRFRGWLDRSEMPALYREADLFVLPSRDEGMPNVLLEAMASGLPAIATDVPGNRDLVRGGETGWLVAAEDSRVLGDVLTRVAGSDTWLAFRTHARNAVCGTRAWRSSAAEYVACLQRAVEPV